MKALLPICLGDWADAPLLDQLAAFGFRQQIDELQLDLRVLHHLFDDSDEVAAEPSDSLTVKNILTVVERQCEAATSLIDYQNEIEVELYGADPGGYAMQPQS